MKILNSAQDRDLSDQLTKDPHEEAKKFRVHPAVY